MDRNAAIADTTFCPYCSGIGRFFVSSTDTNRGTTDANFKYYKCTECGLVFMHPIPGNLRPYYEGGYQTIPGTYQNFGKLRLKKNIE